MKKAVFFDRDGTLIKSVHYLSNPNQVELVDGVAQVLNELERAGYLRIIVTNQAAIGKGLLSEERLNIIQQKLESLLGVQNASIDGWYFCPETRITNDDVTIDHHDRKPGPGMLLKAASDFDISLAESWMVGDVLSDAVAGSNAGCKGTILIKNGLYNRKSQSHPCVDHIVKDISHINAIILQKNSFNND